MVFRDEVALADDDPLLHCLAEVVEDPDCCLAGARKGGQRLGPVAAGDCHVGEARVYFSFSATKRRLLTGEDPE